MRYETSDVAATTSFKTFAVAARRLQKQLRNDNKFDSAFSLVDQALRILAGKDATTFPRKIPDLPLLPPPPPPLLAAGISVNELENFRRDLYAPKRLSLSDLLMTSTIVDASLDTLDTVVSLCNRCQLAVPSAFDSQCFLCPFCKDRQSDTTKVEYSEPAFYQKADLDPQHSRAAEDSLAGQQSPVLQNLSENHISEETCHTQTMQTDGIIESPTSIDREIEQYRTKIRSEYWTNLLCSFDEAEFATQFCGLMARTDTKTFFFRT